MRYHSHRSACWGQCWGRFETLFQNPLLIIMSKGHKLPQQHLTQLLSVALGRLFSRFLSVVPSRKP